MSSTRYSQQPLQIYQDPVTSFDSNSMPSSQNANTRKVSPLRPIKNAASRRNIVFNPPQAGLSKQSPLKSANQNSSSPIRAPFGSNRLNIISMPPPGGPGFNTDSMEKKQPVMSKFKPQKALFTTFNAQPPADKENYPQQYYQAQTKPYSEGLNRANFSLEGLYGQRPIQKKRTLLEAAPIHESRPFKKTKVEEPQEKEEALEQKELPAPDSFEPLHDDGTKPTHSYAQLIGMSILRAQNRRLTLAQIYKWISDTYSFYGATDAGWQNSIRHNLSLNKAFIKQERPKDDPGKGNYWAIQPGMEHQFIKEKPQPRKPANQPQSSSLLPANLPAVNQPEIIQFKTPILPATPELPPSQASQKQYASLPESSHLPAIQELSSDATIPASDALLTDLDDETHQAPSSPLIQSSPPAAMMNSSPPPPVSRQASKRNDTPPAVPRFHSSSRSRSHKRKYASMDDSGYFSSLDSSAMRPHRLISDTDRPRIKRGRAEEEIARLRGSSYDSPTKSRTSFVPPSSSPLRVGRHVKAESTQMLPPLTPAVKLRAPMRPPPSVSPNTNLRMHRDRVREMVGSPLRGMTVLDEHQPWSPAFHLDDMNTSCMFTDFAPDFDIFADPGSFLSVPGNGSPEKRSAKRPRLERHKSANILAEITSSNLNKSLTSTPLLKLTPSASLSFSPLKGLGLMESPTKLLGLDSPSKIGSPSKMGSPSFSLGAFDLPQDDFFGSEFLEDDISGGWDIMQGFQKIGGSNQSNKGTPKQGGRPTLGRSFTSRF